MKAVRSEVHAIDADQPVLTIQTIQEMLATNWWPYRVLERLAS
jgi:hypothetical protein